MHQPFRPLAAALRMTGSILSFPVMAVAGRALALFLTSFQIMLWRSLIGLDLGIAANWINSRSVPPETGAKPDVTLP